MKWKRCGMGYTFSTRASLRCAWNLGILIISLTLSFLLLTSSRSYDIRAAEHSSRGSLAHLHHRQHELLRCSTCVRYRNICSGSHQSCTNKCLSFAAQRAYAVMHTRMDKQAGTRTRNPILRIKLASEDRFDYLLFSRNASQVEPLSMNAQLSESDGCEPKQLLNLPMSLGLSL